MLVDVINWTNIYEFALMNGRQDRTGQTCAKWTHTVAEVQMQLLMLLAIQSIHSVVALSLDVNITCEAQ